MTAKIKYVGKNQISCKRCKPDDEGCSLCGGFKVLLMRSQCQSCRREHWVRPKAETIYDGKQTMTFDGVIIWNWMDRNNTCSLCPSMKGSVHRQQKGDPALVKDKEH